MRPENALSLLLIVLGAFFLPLISRRLRIPSAVGEILYGMILGEHFLGLISQDDFIRFLSQLGFAILMFMAGMEIDFNRLRPRAGGNLSLSLLVVFWVGLLGLLLWYFLGWKATLLLGLGCVSIGLGVAFFKEHRLLSLGIGQIFLSIGFLGELGSIIVLTLIELYHRLGASWQLILELGKFVGIFLVAYLFMRVFRFLVWWFPHRFQSLIGGQDPLELGVRLSFALLFVFLALSTWLGVEMILGAFLAGALFSFVFREREQIMEKLNSIGQGFFIPFFFVVVGVGFDPRVALGRTSPFFFLSLLGLGLIFKLLPSLWLRLGRFSWREIFALGFLFSAPFTLMVAIAEIGLQLGLLSEELHSSLLLLAVVSGLIYPVISRRLFQPEIKLLRERAEGRESETSFRFPS